MSPTGAQIKDVLEQQFAGYSGQTTTKILQVSQGSAYSYDTSLALGSRISGLTLNGTPIDPAATYRVTTNDFVANGGDGFTPMTGALTGPWRRASTSTRSRPTSPLPRWPGPANRITKLG